MYVKKLYGFVMLYENAVLTVKEALDHYNPPTIGSIRWQHWVTQLDLKTCLTCRDKHGEIYEVNIDPPDVPPVHHNCRCRIEEMKAAVSGNGTKDGKNGADWWVKNYGCLPDYYISKYDIAKLGWKPGKAPIKFAPGMMISGGIYRNDNKHLPQALGRVWYEADINYYSGRRNGHRLLWSNDGLVFVTYDHYKTFIEII